MFLPAAHGGGLRLALAVPLALLAGMAPAAGSYGPLAEWGTHGIGGEGTLSHPQSVAAGQDGRVYVSDLGNKRIHVISHLGQFESSWGASGKGAGGFHYPAGVAAHNGSVYVADRDLNRVQKFTPNGTFVLEWGSRGGGEGQLLLPGDLAARGGVVYVADTGNHRVQAFDGDGGSLATFGSSGLGDGQLLTPAGIDVDAHGSVYVADRGNSKVAKFHANGTHAASFSFYHPGYGFEPVAVAVDPDGSMYIHNAATGRIMHVEQDAPRDAGVHAMNGPYRADFAGSDLAMGPNGELIAVDPAAHTLRTFGTPFYSEPENVPPEGLSEEDLGIFFDTTRPVITVPPDVTIHAEDYRTWADIGEANATDASGIRHIVSTAPGSFKPGPTPVLWVAVDNAGYEASGEQTVTVLVCGRSVYLYNVILGTDGNDVLHGTDSDDLIFGLEGDDLVTGGGGDDCIYGGHGDDVVSGGGGDDTIAGNRGHDVLKGGAGSDEILTGEGYDVADGGEGADACHADADDVLLACE